MQCYVTSPDSPEGELLLPDDSLDQQSVLTVASLQGLKPVPEGDGAWALKETGFREQVLCN